MYATVRIYSEAEGLAEAVAEHKAEIVALLRGIDGFRSYHMVKTGPASAASISVYDDQAGPRPRPRWRATGSRPI